MEKDNIFFGERGLTSTSANHLANVAKEMIKDVEYTLNGIHFFEHVVTLMDKSGRTVLHHGNDETSCKQISEMLAQVIEMKEFISWMREAIKAKDRLVDETKDLSVNEILEKMGEEYPAEPEYLELTDNDEYIATLSVKQRNRIYSLQTKAATLGQAVHDNGFFARARKEMLNRFIQDDSYNELNEFGSSHIRIDTYTRTCSKQVIEDAFFSLQEAYRAAQAELNAEMHEITEAVNLENEKRRAENLRLEEEYSSAASIARKKAEDWRQKELRRLSKLRIVIPNDLNETYKRVAGKE